MPFEPQYMQMESDKALKSFRQQEWNIARQDRDRTLEFLRAGPRVCLSKEDKVRFDEWIKEMEYKILG